MFGEREKTEDSSATQLGKGGQGERGGEEG